jgi:hypothetical protein
MIRRASLRSLLSYAIESIGRGFRAIFALAIHTAVALVAAGLFRVFDVAWGLLYGSQEPLVMDKFPQHWVFQFGEVSILSVFVCYGIAEAVRAVVGPWPIFQQIDPADNELNQHATAPEEEGVASS